MSAIKTIDKKNAQPITGFSLPTATFCRLNQTKDLKNWDGAIVLRVDDHHVATWREQEDGSILYNFVIVQMFFYSDFIPLKSVKFG